MTGYDEFSMFQDNAEEAGLAWNGPPTVRRVWAEVEPGRRISALKWGVAEPELVLLHGGAQNAHTWDTVALALGRPLLAVDLPGHGHSDWRTGERGGPVELAADVAVAIEQLAPQAAAVIGMSLGGMTAIALAANHSQLVRRLGLVDVTPGTDHAKAEPIIAFISGPETFESFDEILERTTKFNPTRSSSSLRRGILHNAKELPDGRWTWRWDPGRRSSDDEAPVEGGGGPDFGSLWEAIDEITVPLALYRGGANGTVVGDEDVDELLRRQPDAEVVLVEGAGHSIQGDKPLALAALIEDLLTR